MEAVWGRINFLDVVEQATLRLLVYHCSSSENNVRAVDICTFKCLTGVTRSGAMLAWASDWRYEFRQNHVLRLIFLSMNSS